MIRDLAVMLADGGECVSDLGAVREQDALFGVGVSDSTAFRMVDRIASTPGLMDAVRVAHARARARGSAEPPQTSPPPPTTHEHHPLTTERGPREYLSRAYCMFGAVSQCLRLGINSEIGTTLAGELSNRSERTAKAVAEAVWNPSACATGSPVSSENQVKNLGLRTTAC